MTDEEFQVAQELARAIVTAADTDSEWPAELFRDDLVKFDPRQFPFAPLDGQKIINVARLGVKLLGEVEQLRANIPNSLTSSEQVKFWRELLDGYYQTGSGYEVICRQFKEALDEIERLNNRLNALLQPNCPACGAKDAVTFASKEERFSYGAGPRAVSLTAIVDIGHCSACGLEFTDYRAENARSAAVQRHLRKLSADTGAKELP